MKLTIALSVCLLLAALIPAGAVEESTVCLRLAENEESFCKYGCASSYNENDKNICLYECSQKRSGKIKSCNDQFGHATIKKQEPVDVAKPE